MAHRIAATTPRARIAAATWALMAVAAIVVANTVAFAGELANPLIFSDNWTFIDTFLRVALEQGAGVGDFLVKRTGVDHAAPLNKLLMLLNQRWFGLDFALESRVAMTFAVGGWLFVCMVALRDRTIGGLRGAQGPTLALLLVAIAGVHLSLDSTDVYSYPMVTMAHAVYLLAFVTMHATWIALSRGTLWPLAVSAVVFGIVGDDSAILLGAAIGCAATLYGWRSGRWAPVLRALLVLIVVLAACRVVYATLGAVRGTTNPVFNVSMGQRLAALAAQWRDAWQWVAVPLSSGLVAADHLRHAFGAHWLTARVLLTVPMVAAHVWFWWLALRSRIGATWLLAVSVMLMFYANVAGIVLGRVFVRGAAYLDQTRYVIFYQLGVLALLLMAVAMLAGAASSSRMASTSEPDHGSSGPANGRTRGWIASAAALVLLLQVPLSVQAWRVVGAYQAQYLQMARDMQAMARDPRRVPTACTVGVDVCARPEATRIALMDMLLRHRVNLFSPTFQRRHPELAAAATAVGPLPAVPDVAPRTP